MRVYGASRMGHGIHQHCSHHRSPAVRCAITGMSLQSSNGRGPEHSDRQLT